jgi:hypothetical protein
MLRFIKKQQSKRFIKRQQSGRLIKRQQSERFIKRYYNHRTGSLVDNNQVRQGFKDNLDKLKYTRYASVQSNISLVKCEGQEYLPGDEKLINNVMLEFDVNANTAILLSLLRLGVFENINKICPKTPKNNFGVTPNNDLNSYDCNMYWFKKSELDFLKMLKDYNLSTTFKYSIEKISENYMYHNNIKLFDEVKNEIMMSIDMNGFFDVNFQHVTDVLQNYIKCCLMKHLIYYADLTLLKQISLHNKLNELGTDPKISLSYLPGNTPVNFNISTTSGELMKGCYTSRYGLDGNNNHLLLEAMKWIVEPLIPKMVEFYR